MIPNIALRIFNNYVKYKQVANVELNGLPAILAVAGGYKNFTFTYRKRTEK